MHIIIVCSNHKIGVLLGSIDYGPFCSVDGSSNFSTRIPHRDGLFYETSANHCADFLEPGKIRSWYSDVGVDSGISIHPTMAAVEPYVVRVVRMKIQPFYQIGDVANRFRIKTSYEP